MDAQGNDFIILDRIGLQASHPSSEMDYKDLAIKACNRKQGIGADGLVLLEDYSEAVDDPLPSGHKPDARMKIYNSDGSLAEMCGSALRCVTSLLYKKTGLTELSILTDSGLKTCEVLFEEDREVIRVMIGRAGFIQEGLIVTLEGMDSSSGSSSVIPDPDRESSSSVIPDPDRESSSSVIPDPDRESSSSVIPGSDRESSSSVIPGSDRESSSSVIPDPDRESSSSVIPGSDRESIPTNTYPTTTAWVIYQLKEKTKSLYRLSEIRIFPIPGDETREAGRVRAQSVRDLATRFGMERAAEELELEYHLHDKILPESPWIADSQLLSDVQSRLVHLKKDEFLPLHYSSGLSAWVIVRMKEIRNRRVKPLSEVRSDIIRELSDAKRLSDTKSFATNWIDRRASSISQSEDALIARQSTSGMDIKARFMDLPIETILYDALFDHQNKQKPKAYELSGKIVVPIVTQIYSGKVEKTDDETVRRIFINRLDPKWFDYWLEDQIRKADVRIYQ